MLVNEASLSRFLTTGKIIIRMDFVLILGKLDCQFFRDVMVLCQIDPENEKMSVKHFKLQICE